jgi:hypothetical protein
MSIPTYVLSDLQAIEREAAAHLSAIFECVCSVSGNRADHPRTGRGGTDVGGERQIVATIGEEHVACVYYSDLCAAYEWEGRGSYGLYLANEITRRHERQHGTPTAPLAGDAGTATATEDDETEIVTENENEMEMR